MGGWLFIMSKHGNLKRGTVREDGMIFWRYDQSYQNKEYWINKTIFDKKHLKIKKNKEIIKSKTVRIKHGEIRKDGKIFWGYNPLLKNTELWITKKQFLCKKEKIKEKSKTEKGKKYKREYENNKRIKNLLYGFQITIRSLIGNAIKRNGFRKKSKTIDILGCSFEEFKAHIESQFQSGMSWENRHLWHIDHIMPVSMAKTYDEVVRLNHYRNLRPLWAHENLSKSNKTPETLVLF
jgi:hypothetical protein